MCTDCKRVLPRAGVKPKQPIPLQTQYKPLRRIFVSAAASKPEEKKEPELCVVDEPLAPPPQS